MPPHSEGEYCFMKIFFQLTTCVYVCLNVKCIFHYKFPSKYLKGTRLTCSKHTCWGIFFPTTISYPGKGRSFPFVWLNTRVAMFLNDATSLSPTE